MKKTINDFMLDKAWAISEAKYNEIRTFLDLRASGQITEESIKAIIGPSGNIADEKYEVIDRTAIIPVVGVLAKKANMITDFSGGTSMELIRKDFEAALEDPAVDSIIMKIESPGGTVDGSFETADLVFKSRGKKPIIAYIDGQMASAAALIGTAADFIIASSTSVIGSVGVYREHTDRSEALKQQGIKKTNISAGKYKTIYSSNNPLSEEGRAVMQAPVDTYYTMLVEAVAKQRNASVDMVLDKMAEGREFIGQEAVDVELIDQIGSFDDALEKSRSKKTTNQNNFNAQEESIMTPEDYLKSNPEGYKAIMAAGKAEGLTEGKAAGLAEGKAAGLAEGKAAAEDSDAVTAVKTETETSILALVGASFGDEAKASLEKMLAAKMTAEHVIAAKSFLGTGTTVTTVQTTEEQILKGIESSQGEALGDTKLQGEDTRDFRAKVDAYKLEKSCTEYDGIKAIRATDEAGYEKWMESEQKK
ncbi:signal peptide peptidase SppA [Candidatus Pacearchaeota archaeon]|nr:signal peptide peptidase SppA [Candidatus Pacearchaeota archaeon]